MSNLVTFEQEQILKMIGFPFKKKMVDYVDDLGRWCKAEKNILPTVSEALDRIREKKGIACSVGLNVNSDNRFLGDYIYEYVTEGNRVEGYSGFDTYPLASSALLTAVLNYLIEKEK